MLVITDCVNEYLIPASKFLWMFCNSHVINCFLFKMLFGSRIFFKTFLGKEFSLQILRRMHQFCYIITSKQKLVQQQLFHKNEKIFWLVQCFFWRRICPMFLLKDLSNGRTPEVMKFLPGQNQNHFCFVGKYLFWHYRYQHIPFLSVNSVFSLSPLKEK